MNRETFRRKSIRQSYGLPFTVLESDAKTLHGNWRVSALRGWVGENIDRFEHPAEIPLVQLPPQLASSQRRLKLSSSKAAGSSETEAYRFHPPAPSCRDSSITGGYIARRRTTENEVRVGRVSARRGWEGEKDAVSAAARPLL